MTAAASVRYDGDRPGPIRVSRRLAWRTYRSIVREVRAGRVRRLRPTGLTSWVLEVEVGVPARPVRVEYGGWTEVHTPAGWVLASTSGRSIRRALLAEYPLSALVERVCRSRRWSR